MTRGNACIEHPTVETLFVARGTGSQIAFFNRESAERWIADRREPSKYTIIEFAEPSTVRLQALRDAREAASRMTYSGDYYSSATDNLDLGVKRATFAIERLIAAEEVK